MLTVGVLGPVEAHRDGVRLEVPAGKTTELLARLALEAGARVRTDVLIEDLWTDPTGRNTLQSKVSQLRRALGDREAVVGHRDGYSLSVEAEAVDALRAIELGAASAAARAAADPATALERAQPGLALFRGEVLVEAGDWAAAHRTRLEEVRLGLVEDALAARVDLGAGGEVVAELEGLVEQHPLREALWCLLILALYRSGRQADALAAYARVRRLLLDELGVDPGVELRTLEQQVLQQRVDLGSRVTRPAGVPGNLPPPGRPIVGRAEDLAALPGALRAGRLLTLVGPAGVGKTRLALEVAPTLVTGGAGPAGRALVPGGVWLVRLDAVPSGGSAYAVSQAVHEALHVGGDRELRALLAEPGTVLLLDNCEHVAVAIARLVQRLLEEVPSLRVLATSQVPLGLDAEHVHRVQPLSQEESVSLFARRAEEVPRPFVLDEATAALVEQVCRRLDGLPLAIELAAARVRSLSVRDIARHLDDRFTVLRDPSSQSPERRRALAGAIGWSYDLLFPDDQRGLWALSCFAGSASLDGFEHVLGVLGVPKAATLDTVTRLVDRSLVSLEEDQGGVVRYRLLDSVRAYAADRLLESGQLATVAAAHAEWYAGVAAWSDERVRTRHQPECLSVARAERANVDAALAWCAEHDRGLGLRIALGCGWTWVVLGDGPAGAARLRSALYDGAPPVERAQALLLAGWLEASAGDLALAQADLDAARSLGADDESWRADLERHEAFLAIQQGRPELVSERATSSLRRARDLGDGWRAAGAAVLAAYGALMVGDTAVATRHGEVAVDLLATIADPWVLVHAQAMLGGVAQAEHRLADAAAALERAAEESAAMGFLGQAALHRATLGRVLQRLGDSGAAEACERAIGEAVSVGDGRLAATARLTLARLHRVAGEVSAARELLELNARWYESAGGGDLALVNAAVLASVRDDADRLAAVLERARSESDPEAQLWALDGLARLVAEAGDEPRAAALLHESDALAAGLAHVVDDSDRFDALSARDLLDGHQAAASTQSAQTSTITDQAALNPPSAPGQP